MEVFIISTVVLVILLVLLYNKYSALKIDYNILNKKYKALETKFNENFNYGLQTEKTKQ